MKTPILISCFLFVAFVSINAQVEKVHIEFNKISNNAIIVWGGKVYKDQIAAIATEKGIVVIDAGKSPTITGEYRKIIEKELGRNDFTYLINTHYHFDHTGGNQVFSETVKIAHQKSPALMKEWEQNRKGFVDTRRSELLPRWEKQRDESEPGSEQWELFNDIVTSQIVMLDDYEKNYVLTLPDITFSDRIALDLGNITLKLYYWGDGLHTGDDILIYCPEEKILFSGDLFNKGSFRIAYQPKFDIERWIPILEELLGEEGKIEWVYDCHHGKMPGRFISLFGRYMKDIWNTLLKAKQAGMSLEKIVTDYSFKKKFSYIIESGLDESVLEEDHNNNLKILWEYLNR